MAAAGSCREKGWSGAGLGKHAGFGADWVVMNRNVLNVALRCFGLGTN